MMISHDQLQELFPRANAVMVDAFAAQCGQVFHEFGISANNNRLHFFLAQIGHESGGLTIIEENLNYSAHRLPQVWPKRFPSLEFAQLYAHNPEKLANYVYANRMGNGPSESGDGWRYRGRGFIQITGRDAYKTLGSAANLDLVNQPERAYAPDHALLVACNFWKWKKLNPICDKGDFSKVTLTINGGLTGLHDREAWLDKVRRILTAQTENPTDLDASAVVIAVQKALRAKGYVEVGAADGLLGPRTQAAITHFRQKVGLSDSGQWIDPPLLQAMGVSF